MGRTLALTLYNNTDNDTVIVIICILEVKPCWVGLVVSMSASHMVGCGFASRPGHTKDHHKNGTNCLSATACMR